MRIITYIITFYYNHFYLDLDQLSFVQQNLSDFRLSKKEPRKKSELYYLIKSRPTRDLNLLSPLDDSVHGGLSIENY